MSDEDAVDAVEAGLRLPVDAGRSHSCHAPRTVRAGIPRQTSPTRGDHSRRSWSSEVFTSWFT